MVGGKSLGGEPGEKPSVLGKNQQQTGLESNPGYIMEASALVTAPSLPSTGRDPKPKTNETKQKLKLLCHSPCFHYIMLFACLTLIAVPICVVYTTVLATCSDHKSESVGHFSVNSGRTHPHETCRKDKNISLLFTINRF